MPEPRKPVLRADVSTRTLERAAQRLPLARYPARLAVIHAELQRRAQGEEERVMQLIDEVLVQVLAEERRELRSGRRAA